MEYPEQKWTLPTGYRGAPYLVKIRTAIQSASPASSCEFVCPPKAIRITPPGPNGQKSDRANAEKMPAEFEINMLRCIYCGFCQEVCPERRSFCSRIIRWSPCPVAK